MIPLIQGAQNSQIYRNKKNGGYLGLGRGSNGELLFNEYRVSVWDVEKVLGVDSSDGCRTM